MTVKHKIMIQNSNLQEKLTSESVFTIGTVCSVKGRDILVKVNKDKNLPHLFFNGEIIKNVSVGLSSYVKILKGFTEIICKVEGEFLEEDKYQMHKEYVSEKQKINRFLNVSVFGFYDDEGKFRHGIKELPLIGSQCKLLSKKEFEKLHQLSIGGELMIPLGSLVDEETQRISLSVKNLFAGHAGIFGNTGSGKSNTLAKIYTELFKLNTLNDSFYRNSKFIFIDFNGEYSKNGVLVHNKKSYILSTRKELNKIDVNEKLPLSESSFVDIELLSIFANATEKTQKLKIPLTILKII